jgi:hypothetical protein
MINIITVPTNKKYESLIDVCVKYCNEFILVIRDNVPKSANAYNIINDFDPFLIKNLRKKEWPGTILLNSEANVYFFSLNKDSLILLKSTVSGLYSWLSPSYPEDLCLLTNDENPFLVSIAHEKDSYIVTTNSSESEILEDLDRIGIKYNKS